MEIKFRITQLLQRKQTQLLQAKTLSGKNILMHAQSPRKVNPKRLILFILLYSWPLINDQWSRYVSPSSHWPLFFLIFFIIILVTLTASLEAYVWNINSTVPIMSAFSRRIFFLAWKLATGTFCRIHWKYRRSSSSNSRNMCSSCSSTGFSISVKSQRAFSAEGRDSGHHIKPLYSSLKKHCLFWLFWMDSFFKITWSYM